jgi:N6-L-threonylcarbamoyladenine synthase
VARILGLGYPGGPIVAKMAKKTITKTKITKILFSNAIASEYGIRLPRPMIYQRNYDFSFSGLKTAVLYKVKGERFKMKNKKYIQEMCFEVQQAVIDVLIYKTLKAVKNFKAKSVILGGGVAANEELRKQFQEKIKKELPDIQYLIPNIQYCTDNAAMVAVTAYFNREKATKNWQKIQVNANLKI